MYESRLVGVLIFILLSEVGGSNHIYTKVHAHISDRNIGCAFGIHILNKYTHILDN